MKRLLFPLVLALMACDAPTPASPPDTTASLDTPSDTSNTVSSRTRA